MRICKCSTENLFGNTNDSFIRPIAVNHSDDEFSSSFSFSRGWNNEFGFQTQSILTSLEWSGGVGFLLLLDTFRSSLETLSCSFFIIISCVRGSHLPAFRKFSKMFFLVLGSEFRVRGSFGRYPLSFGGLK